MNIENLNLVIVTRPLYGIKRGTIGEVYQHNGQYRVRFGKYETMHRRFLEYALSTKQVKPYVRAEDAQELLSMRTGGQDGTGGLPANQSDGLQRAKSLPLPMQKALAAAQSSRNKQSANNK